MNNHNKTKDQTIEEIEQLKQRIAALEDALDLAREKLEKSASDLDLYREIFEKAPLAIYILQNDAIYLANPRTSKQFGISEAELPSRQLIKLVLADDQGQVLQYLNRVSQGDGSATSCIFRLKEKEGNWVKLSAMPILWKNQSAMLCFQKDITAQKRDLDNLQIYQSHLEEMTELRTTELKQALEKAEMVNDLKDSFLANIGHEMRTPIHQISNFSSFGIKKVSGALEKQVDIPKETLLKYFKNIHSANETLFLFIKSLFELSTLEGGEISFQFIASDVAQLIQRIADEQRDAFTQNSLVFEMVPSEISTKVMFDPNWISELLKQIFFNAIKISSAGDKITVSFQKAEVSQYGLLTSGIQVNISDQGVGIPEDELNLIFEKFTQSSRTADGSGGRGIGLAICKSILSNHKGEIWATNNPQGGATFSFTLPYQQKSDSTSISSEGFDESGFDV